MSDKFLERYKRANLFENNLHGYQRLAADFMWRVPFCAVWLDTG